MKIQQKYFRWKILFILQIAIICSSSFKVEFTENPSYAVDPLQTARLAKLEHHLVTKLASIDYKNFVQTDLCGAFLLKYINEYTQDGLPVVFSKRKDNQEFSKTFSENPILAFKMIRRIYITLVEKTLNLACNDNDQVTKTIKETFHEANVKPPRDQDYEEAMLGILRIQFIYGLNASQMQQGIFNEIKTNVNLSFADCLDLSKKAMLLNVEVMAYQWLEVADKLQNDTDVDLEVLENTWQNFVSTYEGISIKESKSRYQNKRQLTFPNLYGFDHYATCRGEKKKMPFGMEKPSNLKCLYASYKWDPYFSIGPVKVEVLVEEPSMVLQFHDFVSDDVIEFVERETNNKLTRSVEANVETGSTYVNHQSSMISWIDDGKHEILKKLRRRIEKLSGLEQRNTKRDGMKVVLYGVLGGFYDFHHDAIIDASSSNAKKGNGETTSTFMMFLTHVKMGGFTAFPDLGVFVRPTKGSALLWYSILPNGKPDPWVQHGGCPVILGRKQILLVDG